MRPPIVVDASAVVHLLLADDLGDTVAAALDGHVPCAPAHLDAEVLSAMARLARDGRSPDLAGAMDDLAAMPLARWPLEGLLRRAAAMAESFSTYDALYLALAEELDAQVVTLDRRLVRAVPDRARLPATG